MSTKQKEMRIGGQAGQDGCTPLSDVVKIAIANSDRDGHGIDTKAVQYGTEPVINLHQGEITQSDLDTGLRGVEPNQAMPDLPGPANR